MKENKKWMKYKFNNEKKNIVSEETYLKLKRSNEKKKAVIVILIYTICLMSIPLVLFYSCLKNGPQYNDEPQLGDVEYRDGVKALDEVDLQENNQQVQISGKQFFLRIEKENEDAKEGSLFINDQEIVDEDGYSLDANMAYITDNFIFFTSPGDYDDDIVYAIDYNGNPIDIIKNNYQMHYFRFKNGIIMANGYSIIDLLEGEDNEIELMLVYNNNQLIVEPYS